MMCLRRGLVDARLLLAARRIPLQSPCRSHATVAAADARSAGAEGEGEGTGHVRSAFLRTAAAVMAPTPLVYFDVHYERGGGTFTMVGRGPREGVFVTCSVPPHHKPPILQLGSGRSEEDGYDRYDGDNHGDPAGGSALEASQRAYERHLWTTAQQRLTVGRRRQQAARRQKVARGVLAALAAAHAGGRLPTSGRLQQLCPPRSDVVPPAPRHATPPPRTTGTDPNRPDDPHDPLVRSRDPREQERERHQRQRIAIAAIVGEDRAEQLPVRFRVGLLRRHGPPAAAPVSSVSDLEGSGVDQEMEGGVNATLGGVGGGGVGAGPPMLHLCCSTISPAAALCIDRAQFYADPSLLLSPSLRSASRNLRQYMGPQLHQRPLANYACGREGSLNASVWPHYAGHLSRAGPAYFFRGDVHAERCLSEAARHSPVHTLPPLLHESIRAAAAARGVDDQLSLYVHLYAQYVFCEERRLWHHTVMESLRDA